MSNPNIEIPEEIKATAQRVLDGRENFISSTVEMAEFILDLNKPEIEVENFVVYKVKCAGKDYAGYRFEASHCWKKWSLVEIEDAYGAEHAVPQFGTGILAEDSDVEVLERWTPEVAQPEFGIGEARDDVDLGRKVLVKGTIGSTYVDDDGDVRVEMTFAGGIEASHYVSAKDIAYVEEV